MPRMPCAASACARASGSRCSATSELYGVGLEVCAAAAGLGASPTHHGLPGVVASADAAVGARRRLDRRDRRRSCSGSARRIRVEVVTAAGCTARRRPAVAAGWRSAPTSTPACWSTRWPPTTRRSRSAAALPRRPRAARARCASPRRRAPTCAVAVGDREWKIDDGRDPAGAWIEPAGRRDLHRAAGGLRRGRLGGRRRRSASTCPAVVDEPVRCEVRGGRVVYVQGGRHAAAFRELDRQAERRRHRRARHRHQRARADAGQRDDGREGARLRARRRGLQPRRLRRRQRLTVHCDCCFGDASIEADGRLVHRARKGRGADVDRCSSCVGVVAAARAVAGRSRTTSSCGLRNESRPVVLVDRGAGSSAAPTSCRTSWRP